LDNSVRVFIYILEKCSSAKITETKSCPQTEVNERVRIERER